MNNTRKGESMKSEKGITLITLATYIVLTTITLAILATVSNYFYNNVYYLDNKAMYAAEFNKFNVYMVQDVKRNSRVNIQVPTAEKPYQETIIAFGNGNRYIYYNEPDSPYKHSIYRVTQVKDADGNPVKDANGNVKENISLIAGNITKFEVSKETKTINRADKILLNIEMKIGNHTEMNFWHNITYTLKYW